MSSQYGREGGGGAMIHRVLLTLPSHSRDYRAAARRRAAPTAPLIQPSPPPPAPRAPHAPPPLPYKVDTSRPSLRTNWTRLVHPSVLIGHGHARLMHPPAAAAGTARGCSR